MTSVAFGLPESDLKKLIVVFKQYPVATVTLYGSRAQGNYRNNSDIDLCLDGDGISFSVLSAIERDIDDLLLPWKVDLSIKSKITNKALVEEIDRFGKTIYEK